MAPLLGLDGAGRLVNRGQSLAGYLLIPDLTNLVDRVVRYSSHLCPGIVPQ